MEASITLGLENSKFAAGIDQAEKRAESFSNKVGRLLGGSGRSPWDEFIKPIPNATRQIDSLEGKITGFFKRDPTHRAEVALSEFAANLSTGNVAGAVTGLATKITGFGLAAGIAIGAGIELISRFRGQVVEATKAEHALANELATIGGVRGPEEATKKIADLGTSTQALIDKVSTGGNRIANFLDKFINPLVGTSPKNRGAAQAAEITSGLLAEGKLMGERADAEAKLVAIKDESLNVSERQAALDKIALDASIKRSAINEEAKSFKLGLFRPEIIKGMTEAQKKKWQTDRDNLIRASEEAAKRRKFGVSADEASQTDELNKQFDLKKSEADIESKILELKRQGVTEEQRTTAETRLRIALLRSQLRTSTTEQKGVIQNKISALKQTLGPDNRPPIGIAGETPQGIYDTNTGEFRTILRPQEVANRRAGEAEAQAKLRDDQSKYASDLTGWQSRYQDYLRGADYYNPEDLKRPTPPAGYDVDVTTGQIKPRATDSGAGPAKPLTKEELQSALDVVMSKFWGN